MNTNKIKLMRNRYFKITGTAYLGVNCVHVVINDQIVIIGNEETAIANNFNLHFVDSINDIICPIDNIID